MGSATTPHAHNAKIARSRHRICQRTTVSGLAVFASYRRPISREFAVDSHLLHRRLRPFWRTRPAAHDGDGRVAAQLLLQNHADQGNQVVSDGSLAFTKVEKNKAFDVQAHLKEISLLQKRYWAMARIRPTEYYLAVFKDSKFAPPPKLLESQLQRLREVVNLHLERLIDQGIDKEEFAHFITRPGVKSADLMKEISKVLDDPALHRP
jgi:hypothetical protein